MIPRSFAIDSYIRDTHRTCVLIRRADGRIGAHDIHTGALLGIVDPNALTYEPPVGPSQRAMFAAVCAVVALLVGIVCFAAGRALAGG